MDHTRKASKEIKPTAMSVHFAENLRGAFSDLRDAVQSSPTFDPELKTTLLGYAAGKNDDVLGFMLTLANVADEVHMHAKKTGDSKALAAWKEVQGQILENGITLAPAPKQRGRS